MKTLIIKPDEWPCLINECPPGFFLYKDQLCFKSEYGPKDAFNSAGEYFCVEDAMVQPVVYEWIES